MFAWRISHIDIVKGFFGMHVQEISSGVTTLSLYFGTTCVLTAVTIWILVAFQWSDLFNVKEMTFWRRLGWPVYIVYHAIGKADHSKEFRAKSKEGILPK